MNRIQTISFAAGMLLLVAIRPAMAANTSYFVCTNGNELADGKSWETAVATISNALKKAGAGDTILVSNGVYKLSVKLDVAAALTITSVNGAAATVLDGQRTTRILNITQPAQVFGFTITNGFTNGVYIAAGASTALLANCVISGNGIGTNGAMTANWGGGVQCYPSTATILNCDFIGNCTTARGGGFWGGAQIKGCRFLSNYGGQGGGVETDVAGSSVSDSIFSNNWTSGGGSAFYTNKGGIVSNCQFINNYSTNSGNGTVVFYSGTTTTNLLIDSVVVGNSNSSATAGIVYFYNGHPNARVENCIIASNWSKRGAVYFPATGTNSCVRNSLICNNYADAANYGSGITILGAINYPPALIASCTIVSNYPNYGLYTLAGSGKFYVTNCIIAGNGNTGLLNVKLAGETTTNEFSYTCIPNVDLAPDQGNLKADPGFVDFAGRNYRLAKGSPCIDKGINQPEWMATAKDVDGRPRIFQGTVDMGAYERWFAGGAMILFQ